MMRNVVIFGVGGFCGSKLSQIKDERTHRQRPAGHAGEDQTQLQEEG